MIAHATRYQQGVGREVDAHDVRTALILPGPLRPQHSERHQWLHHWIGQARAGTLDLSVFTVAVAEGYVATPGEVGAGAGLAAETGNLAALVKMRACLPSVRALSSLKSHAGGSCYSHQVSLVY